MYKSGISVIKPMTAIIAMAIVILCLIITGCGPTDKSSTGYDSESDTPADFVILAGSENKTLEPIVREFADRHRVKIKVEYMGSVDIMLKLERDISGADAVWPANSIWIDLGDRNKVVKQEKSIMRSPVVLGVKKSVATKLGWIGKDVRVNDVMRVAESGKLKFMMTSASQSNSGAVAYLGYLYAFAGNPDVITSEHLADPAVRKQIKRLLGTVNRSAGSSGWLKDLFLERYDDYDAMVNYEAVIIEANQELAKKKREPLYAVYLVDGLAIADSPLGYVDHGNSSKQKIFDQLQAHLLSPEVQNKILGLGRRAGMLGMDIEGADKRVFNPDWGIDPARMMSPIKFPSPDVIRQAISLYQTAFRKPSFTVYCLDYSGSMIGQGSSDLKNAMRILLDQKTASTYFLQSSPDDVTIVIPFSGNPMGEWKVDGNDPARLSSLLQKIETMEPDGSTDIYSPVISGLSLMKKFGKLKEYFPAVILMTDGNSNTGRNYDDLVKSYRSLSLGLDIPVFAIQFGSASETQLEEITTFTSGCIFDGRKDLVEAFRKAKGYN